MSYQDRQLVGSLGGVDLLIKTISSEGGRRVTSLEFPGRDAPSFEDHGRAARRWQVEAVLVGDNWDVDLQTLRDVFSSKGPHRFVHPTEGPQTVVLDGKPTWVIDYNAHGVCQVSFAVVESGEPGAQLRVAPSTAVDLSAATEAMQAALIASVVAGYDVTAGGSTFGRAQAALVSALVAVNIATGKVLAALSVVDTVSTLIADAEDAAVALTAVPEDMIASLKGIWDAASALITDADAADTSGSTVDAGVRAEALRQTVSVSGGWDPEEDAEETDDPQEALNDQAISAAVALTAVATAAATLQTLTLDTADTANAILEAMAESIDAQMEAEIVNDELYAALVDLKAAVDAHLRELAGRLPSITTVTPAETLPALLLAFELCGDPEEDEEILARNVIQNPTFVPGGEELEVILG